MYKMLPSFNSGRPRVIWRLKNFARVSALCFVFSLVTAFTYGQSQLLKDVNTMEQLIEGEYASLVPSGGILYINSRGIELWKTTGTAGGTVRIKTLSNISNLTDAGGTLYFSANNGTHGIELWKSNGTASTTVMVKDVLPTGSSNPSEMTFVNNTVFFAANGPSGRELWKTDGTAAGTVLVKDIMSGVGSSNPAELTAVNGTLYFTANNGQHGYELWKSDGTAAGTVMVKDIWTDARMSSRPRYLANLNGAVVFTADTPDKGREWWKSDGTAAGTVLIKDLNPGAADAGVENRLVINGALYFSGTNGVVGHELWKTNGTEAGTVLVKDMTPGPRGSNGSGYATEQIRNFANIGGKLFFTAYENGTLKVWRSDGTTAGTIAIEVMSTFAFQDSRPAFAGIGTTAYYFNTGYVGDHPAQILRRLEAGSTTPTTVTTFAITTIDEYEYYNEQNMVTYNNNLYMNGIDGGYKLYKSNGTAAGTVVLKDFVRGTLGSYPEPFAVVNNLAFFTAQMGMEKTALWATDGTPGGTLQLFPGASVMAVGHTDNAVYFFEFDSYMLWKTDGTVAGTVPIVSADIPFADIRSRHIGNTLLFTGYPGGLWRTDGTEAGTEQLSTSDIIDLYAVGNTFYFIARDPGNLFNLWKSDGTAAGTTLVKNLSNATWENVWAKQRHTSLNGILYFIATDNTHGAEVWRTDGTAAGTYMFADLNTLDNNNMGSYDFDIASLQAYEGNVYISALDNSGVWGLYKSDGIATPTRLLDMYPVSNMIPMPGRLHLFATYSHTYPQAITDRVYPWVTDGTAAGTVQLSTEPLRAKIEPTPINNVLYFTSTFSYASGTLLYRSDGTACGTYLVETGVTLTPPIQAVNGYLVFPAPAALVGVEPHAYNTALDPGSPCATSVASVGETTARREQDDAITPHPNPFTSSFTLAAREEGHNDTQIVVVTASGLPVETISNVSSRTGIELGGTWPPGVYIVKVNRGGTVQNYMVVKK